MVSILMIPNKMFPCQHAVLETVYTQILSRRGYDVSWLMLSSDVRRAETTTWNGTKVHLIPYSDKPGLQFSLHYRLAWMRLLATAVWLTIMERYNIVQVRNSIFAAAVSRLVTRLTRTRIVYQLSFPVPENLILKARNGGTRMPWLNIIIGKVALKFRHWVMDSADLVLAISDEMRNQLISSGIGAGKIMSFPLGTDCPPEPEATTVSQLRTDLNLDGHPVIIYLGTIAPNRQLDFLIDVAKHLKLLCPSARWLFVGPAHDGEDTRLRQLAQELKVADEVILTGPVARSQTTKYLALANVSVSPIPPTPVYWVSSPTKLVESLALGCPVVATSIPDQAEIITASGGGIVAPFEAKAFAEAIFGVLADPDKAKQMGEAGRLYVRQYRSYEFLAEKLHQRFQLL